MFAVGYILYNFLIMGLRLLQVMYLGEAYVERKPTSKTSQMQTITK